MSPQRPDTSPAMKPIEVSAELKALMRRLKLGLDRLELPLRPPPDVQLRSAVSFEHAGGPALPVEGP